MRAIVIALALALGVAVLSNVTWSLRRHQRELAEYIDSPDRYLDISVRLNTVVADEANGREFLAGKPKLRVVRSRVLGGILDTRTGRVVTGRCAPIDWYCSEEQEPIILHTGDTPLGQLVYGSEGAGKTTALVQWLYVRWLEHLGTRAEIGVTAPTETRLGLVLRELQSLWPAAWFVYRVGDGIIDLPDGDRIRFVSTYRQSQAQGSRVQGFTWVAAAGDEAQDSVDTHEDIESRGRGAPGGRYKQLRTATAKDDPMWRDLRDKLDAARDAAGKPLWIRRTLLGERSPFVHPSFWSAKRAAMSPREAKRRLDASDVGPERATYPDWSREKNLIVVPEIGWRDVTADELRAQGGHCTLLGGHDPGSLVDVTLLLKAFITPQHKRDDRPIWVVVDEVTTEQSTTEAHVRDVLRLARERYRCNLLDRTGRVAPGAPELFVRADPAGNTDNRTDISVYKQWANAGVRIKPAAYSKSNPVNHGRVPRDAGIEMVNTLICSATGLRRLYVARRPDGSPSAPRLVAALETSERDLAGKAETQLKRKGDVSHWPAALRYALWAIERPKLGAVLDAWEHA